VALRDYWNGRFLNHMADEETVLLGLLNERLRSRLLAEHKTLRALFASVNSAIESGNALEIDGLTSLASLLRSHIQWEERRVFPYLQNQFSERELQKLAGRLHGHRVPADASCSAVTDTDLPSHIGQR